jgi:PilZ domain
MKGRYNIDEPSPSPPTRGIIPLMDEHRIAPRHRKLKAGTIEFGGGGIDCTIRNMSETGAALEVVTPLFIPDRFTLFVLSENLKKPCHIVWRREKRIGVAFD